jgi:DNA-binding transcriptional MerR regulator
MRGIGEMARASGLSVSALRFYDGAGVLVPAAVDPATGYRRYADEQVRTARLVAGLRRVGMPLADITRAVRDPSSVRGLLARHRQRLEDGLADARRELSRIHALLDLEERAMTRATLPAAALAAALDAVRFAASTDPGLPMLGGVLIEAEAGAITLVTTDRYRLAVARTAAAVEGPPIRLVVPLPLADAARALLTGDTLLTGSDLVTLDLGERVVVDVGGRRAEGGPLDADFPDHRRLLHDSAEPERVTVDVAALRAAIAAAPPVWREHDGTTYPISILTVDPAGGVRLAAEAEWTADAEAHVAVNREFLLEALDAGGAGQLVLELDGPIKPLAVRPPGDVHRFSVLMPVRH